MEHPSPSSQKFAREEIRSKIPICFRSFLRAFFNFLDMGWIDVWFFEVFYLYFCGLPFYTKKISLGSSANYMYTIFGFLDPPPFPTSPATWTNSEQLLSLDSETTGANKILKFPTPTPIVYIVCRRSLTHAMHLNISSVLISGAIYIAVIFSQFKNEII